MRGMSKEWARRIASRVTLLASILSLGATRLALAAPQTNPLTLPNPLGANSTFSTVVASVTNFLLIIAVPLVTIMALVGGFQMITAAGNPEKFASGRKTLMYAIIGFAVVILAGGIAQIIQNFLGGNS